MSLEAILAVLAARGLSVAVDATGACRLSGPRAEATPALMEAVAAYRDEIVERFRPPPLEPVPDIVYWLMASGVVLVSLPGHERRSVARMRVPHGAESFRARADAPWRPLLELPAHWGLVAQGPPAATPITLEEEADTDT